MRRPAVRSGPPDRHRATPPGAARHDSSSRIGTDGAHPSAARGGVETSGPSFPDSAASRAADREGHHRGTAPDPPLAAPGLPDRRPGDPPGVPAELFVETTTETPALRLDDLPPELDERSGTAEADEAAPRRRKARAGPGGSLLRRLRPDRDAEPATGHGHGPARPAGRRVRIVIAALLVPCALATLVGLVLLWPTGGPPPTAGPITQEQVLAQVTATRVTDCTQGSGDGACVALVVHMADGPRPDRDLVQVVPVEPGSPRFAVGDQVVLAWSGADPEDAGSYQIVDFQRGAPLAWLAGLFAAAVLLLGRWRGLAALAALALSFVVLLLFVVPAILAGRDPLAVAVVGSCLIMFVVLYLTHGPSARTSTAVLGTLLSLALIGGLGAAFAGAAKLTGLDEQTSNLIASLGTGVDARGLLLAGVVIGALGVLDDVTVTQTSAVWELREANPQLGARALFTRAMRIGRDHVASAVNTLVLAYAGAALPLLLLFSLSGRGIGVVVTAQDVATEIVRTLVGSIGLVASVPITTAIAAAVAVRETRPAPEPEAVRA
ncbi:YibE/F family protein [Pseudonocardia sp. MH-G8]|nr:YibE/F family protein [Pseudonocardia sp. MH-G8]